MKTKLYASILSVTCALAGGASLHAQTTSYLIGSGGLESFNLQIDSSVENDALAGSITATAVSGPGSSLASICTDISATLWLGGTYTYNAPATFSGQQGIDPNWGAYVGGNPTTANEIQAIQAAADIFAKYGNSLYSGSVLPGLSGTLNDERAGLQLAIWTALYNTSATGGVGNGPEITGFTGGGRFTVLGLGDLTSGAWNVTTGTSTAEADAQIMLNNVNFNDQYTGNILVPNPITQNGGYGPIYDQPAQELLTQITPLPETKTILAGSLLLLPFAVSMYRTRKTA